MKPSEVAAAFKIETKSKSNQTSPTLSKSSTRGARPRSWLLAMRIIPPRKMLLTTVDTKNGTSGPPGEKNWRKPPGP